MMHNQAVYLQQGQQSGPSHLVRSPQQNSQTVNQAGGNFSHNAPPSQPPSQFMLPSYPVIQHVPANQLPQVPAALFHHPDTPFLMCIPMVFNARDCTFVYQNGVIVAPNTATQVAGYNIMHQLPPPQQHQQPGQHQQPMQNGYGPMIHHPTQLQQNFSDNSGSSSSSGLARSSPSASQPNISSSNMQHVYGFPLQSLSAQYQTIQQHLQQPLPSGQFYGPPPPGFNPSQTVSHGYGQSSSHLPGQPSAQTGQTSGGRSEDECQLVTPSNSGLVNGSPSDSSVQSRSSSYSSSALDGEQALDGHVNGSADSETLHAETTFSRSTTPSPEPATRLAASFNNIERNSTVQAIAESEQANFGHSAFEPASQKSPEKTTGGRITSSTLPNGDIESAKGRDGGSRTNSAASINRSVTQSPTIAQPPLSSSAEKVILPSVVDGKSESQKDKITGTTTPTPLVNAPSPVPPTIQPPKTWAALVGSGGPKVSSPALTTNTAVASTKPVGRSPASGASDGAHEKPTESDAGPGRTGGRVPPPSTATRDDYHSRHSANGGPSGPAGQAARAYEFPKLDDRDADVYPDDLQVYIRDIPVAITSDAISNAMKRFGDLVDVRLRYHQGTRQSRFCFVLFRERAPAQTLLEKGSVQINGHDLVVQRKKRTFNSYINR